MSSVPIVQGVAVDPSGKNNNYAASNYQQQNNNYDQNNMTVPINAVAGDQQQQLGMHAKQPNQFRDSFWAILFILHFIPLVFYAVYYNNAADDGQAEGGASLEIGPHIFWISVVALVSVGLSTLSLEGMMRNAPFLIKASLFFTVGLSALVGVYGLMTGQIFVTILAGIQFAIGICYAYAVWSRIPYAAANLRTGLTAVRLNLGLVLVAYFFMAVGFAWTILFFMGFGSAIQDASYPILFCWLLSFYWVHQVLQYTVHVICAGVVATWWFSPLEAASCFSSALQDSMVRALTYSFGSICFGAFLVAAVRALRVTLETARRNDDAQFLVCIIECFLRCIEDMLDYLNQWAYVYVGIYGFSYLEAGKEVINLFQQRGWSVIIADDLVDRVLLMISMCIGLVSGLVGLFTGQDALANAGVEEPAMIAFLYAFLVGFLFSSIALGIIGSAVNTVIVLFCEAPAEFQNNHPQLSNEMRAAWTGEWPELNVQ